MSVAFASTLLFSGFVGMLLFALAILVQSRRSDVTRSR